jgi:hypothetical protein
VPEEEPKESEDKESENDDPDDSNDSEAEMGKPWHLNDRGVIADILTERLKNEWNAPVYAFFGSTPTIEYVDGHQSHVFKCLRQGCGQTVRRFLDKGDAKSTGNLLKHVRTSKCWGEDMYKQIAKARDIDAAHAGVKGYLANGSISVAFGKGQLTHTYSSHPMTKLEIK